MYSLSISVDIYINIITQTSFKDNLVALVVLTTEIKNNKIVLYLIYLDKSLQLWNTIYY